MVSDFNTLTPLYKMGMPKHPQPEWNTHLQNRCEFMDLCHLLGKSVAFLIDEVSIQLGWREQGQGEKMPS